MKSCANISESEIQAVENIQNRVLNNIQGSNLNCPEQTYSAFRHFDSAHRAQEEQETWQGCYSEPEELLVAASGAQRNGSKQHMDPSWFEISEGTQSGRAEQEL